MNVMTRSNDRRRLGRATRAWAVRFPLFGALVLLGACELFKPPCGPATCGGCCDASGNCEVGTVPTACGSAGAHCAACTADEVCLGACMSLRDAGAAAEDGGAGGLGGGIGGTGGGAGTGGTGGGAGGRDTASVMLLVDRSGSLSVPLDPADSRCTPVGCGAGSPCAAGCPTRQRALRAALSAFLAGPGQQLRLGLTAFPSSEGGCSATTAVEHDVPVLGASLSANATAVDAKQQAFVANGGAPIGSALEFLRTRPSPPQAIILLTDGVPNCNAQNANHTCGATNPACKCTLGALGACQNSGSASFTPCSQGCLDDQAVVGTAAALLDAGTKVYVVGVGANVATSDAMVTLNAIAVAGGTATATVSHSATELQTALDAIAVRIRTQ